MQSQSIYFPGGPPPDPLVLALMVHMPVVLSRIITKSFSYLYNRVKFKTLEPSGYLVAKSYTVFSVLLKATCCTQVYVAR